MLLYPLDTSTMMGNNYIYRHWGLELEIIKDYEMIGHWLKLESILNFMAVKRCWNFPQNQWNVKVDT